jgi:hypothetical protein
VVTARKSSRWCMPSFVLDQPCHLRAAVPVHRTRHNAGHLLVRQLRPAELLASQLETFNFRAFNGLVTLPIAVATGQFPPAGLSPAGSAASVPHTVSGFAIRSDLRQPGNHRLAQIQNCRSVLRLRVPRRSKLLPQVPRDASFLVSRNHLTQRSAALDACLSSSRRRSARSRRKQRR